MALFEDIGNTIGAGAITAPETKLKAPIVRRDWNQFEVPGDTFKKFQSGRNRFERWSKFLDKRDPNQAAVYDYATANPTATVVLRCTDTGALRAIRRRSSCDS